jgi:hypothetical protein
MWYFGNWSKTVSRAHKSSLYHHLYLGWTMRVKDNITPTSSGIIFDILSLTDSTLWTTYARKKTCPCVMMINTSVQDCTTAPSLSHLDLYTLLNPACVLLIRLILFPENPRCSLLTLQIPNFMCIYLWLRRCKESFLSKSLYKLQFLRLGVVSHQTIYPEVGGPPLLSCPRLLIQHIRSYLPHLDAALSAT